MFVKNVMDVGPDFSDLPDPIPPKPHTAKVVATEQPTALVRTPAAQPVGRKDDSAKIDMTLLIDDCPHALYAVAEVMQWAITKKQPVPYVRGSWQQVPEFQRRYRAAQIRHELNAAIKRLEGAPEGDECDDETDLRELAHIATGAIFRLEMAIRKSKGLPVPEGA